MSDHVKKTDGVSAVASNELLAVYERYKHLDHVFLMIRDPEPDEQPNPFHVAARELWKAVKWQAQHAPNAEAHGRRSEVVVKRFVGHTGGRFDSCERDTVAGFDSRKPRGHGVSGDMRCSRTPATSRVPNTKPRSDHERE